MMGRLVPQGLTARFALLLVAALLVANLVALALLSQERDRLGRDARELREVERALSLIPALDALEPARRGAIAQAASTRFTGVRVDSQPLLTGTASDRRSRFVARRVSQALGGREVRAEVEITGDWRWQRPEGRPRDRSDDDDRRPRPRAERITLSVVLQGGGAGGAQWVNITSDAPAWDDAQAAGRAYLLVLALSLLSVLGVAFLFLRRLTRPLRQLAVAAQAAGRGDRSARVPETGARETRDAARAFNDMQARIARFDAERMRTLASVGHDLRTPITSLRIRAEMLDDADQSEPMIRTLDEMTVMADGLVAWARGEDGESTQDIDLADCLSALCNERGAQLTVTAGGHIQGRPVALKRAIGNLIDNALRYGGAANVRLARDGDEAVIGIADTGPGIPPDRLDAMFEPFVRGEGSRNLDTGGAGLGLSIARAVVLSHGGRIALTNRPEGGLLAEVRLPVTQEV